MNTKKFTVLTAVLASALSLMTVGVGALNTSAADKYISVPSVSEALPEDNLLADSSFDDIACLEDWAVDTENRVTLMYIEDENGGYLQARPQNTNTSIGYDYEISGEIPAGSYRFSGYFRTARVGELTYLRLIFKTVTMENEYDTDVYFDIYPTNEWMKVEAYVTLDAPLEYIHIQSGAGEKYSSDYADFVTEYCMDSFSLAAVDSVPSDAATVFGTPVTAAQAYESRMANYTPDKDISEFEYDVKGIIINDDSAFLRYCGDPEIDVNVMREHIKQYKNSHITDYFINVNAGVAYYPSEVWTDALDKYYTTEENGVPVDYSEESRALGAHHIYEELDADYIEVWHETLKFYEINPWLSFRMNDLHGQSKDVVTNFLLSEFWYKNPQYRRVQHHTSYKYHADYAYDYTSPEVREYFLSLINESLNRYDTYGIELDFQREIKLWYIGGDYKGIEILNGFMREVDALTKVYEKKYGHEIQVSVRVAPDLETNYSFGLDILTWAAEGIIDMVIPSCRYESNDNDIPVRLWDSLLSPYDIVLAPCIDPTNMRAWSRGNTNVMDVEAIAGVAASMLSQGADKIYFFNYFKGDPSDPINGYDRTIRNAEYHTMSSDAARWMVYSTAGSLDLLLNRNRRVSVTYRDMWQVWEATPGVLPTEADNDGSVTTLRIPVGNVSDGTRLILKFSCDNLLVFRSLPSVTVNSQPCEYAWAEYCVGGYTDFPLMCYIIPDECAGDMYMTVEISSGIKFKIDYAEVYIQAN